MCLEDVQIERAYRSIITTTTTLETLPANSRRVAVRLTCENGDQAVLLAVAPSMLGSPGSINAPIGKTALDPGNTQVLPFETIRLSDVGDIIKGPLLLQSVIGLGVYAIEIILEVDTPMSLDVTKLAKGK